MAEDSDRAAFLLETVVIVTIGYLVVKCVTKYMNLRKTYDGIPGETAYHFLWGTLHKFPGPNEAGIEYDFKMMRDVAPRLARVYAGPINPVVVLHHPETAKVLLKSSEPKPRGKYMAGVYDMGFPWLGEGLLIANGDKWARNRRLLTPAFHFDVLKPYMDVNNQATDILLDKLQKCSEQGKPFEAFNFISLCALDIIMRCAFSFDTDCQRMGDTHPYVQAVNGLQKEWMDRAFKPYLHVDWIYFLTPQGRKFKKMCDYVHQVAEDIIEKRRNTIKESGVPSTQNKRGKRILDFLDILLTAKDENEAGLTSLEIRHEVDTFLFEGHDTTTSGMSWMLYHMSKHPEYQTKVQEEIDAVLEGRDSDHITWEDLPKLEYLSLCLKESLRNRPPVPFIERQLTKEIVLEGHRLPVDSLVGVQIFNLCHNPHVWERPFDYYPERFLSEDVKKQDPFSYVPFSAGPRNCIGQNFAMHEMKVIIARILHRFTLSLANEREIKMQMNAVLRTENGILINVQPRIPESTS